MRRRGGRSIREILTIPIRVRLHYDDQPRAREHALKRMRALLREGGSALHGFGDNGTYSVEILGPAPKRRRGVKR